MQEVFKSLGENWTVADDHFNVLEDFTCKMYDARSNETSVNKLRYLLYSAKRGDLHGK